jgi:hypothetical protein
MRNRALFSLQHHWWAMMDKEPQGFTACIAGTMLTLSWYKEVIAGFDRFPAAIDIGLTMALNHKDRISLFFVGMNGGLGPGRNLKQADSAYIGVLIGYQHCDFDVVEFRMLGENHFTLGKKFRFHNSLLLQCSNSG